MKATDLERELLVKFFKIKHINPKELVKSLNEIEVLDREITGSGFLTEFKKHRCLRVADIYQSYKWGNIGAYLNEERLHVGFLFHVEKGVIEAVEGYTYGETWPEKIICYELFEESVWDLDKGQWVP